MTSLPIDAVLPALRQALSARHEAPGAGKTTRVPLALLEETWLAGQTILMLEPRRLAARAAAERLASELGETVGYRIRLESRVGPKTRIEVVTEGILTRRLQDDLALEAMQRSWQTPPTIVIMNKSFSQMLWELIPSVEKYAL